MDLQNLNEIISQNSIDNALKMLTELINADPCNDQLLYERGKLYWKIGNRSSAITDYNAAAAINPDSKARQALEMSTDIMNFFNPDLLNP